MSDERRKQRERRDWRELHDTIERAWISKFGSVPVVLHPLLAQLRRLADGERD